jgi:hypothetical protein
VTRSAMHPMSPFKGQGTQALLDALSLARAIRMQTLIKMARLECEKCTDSLIRNVSTQRNQSKTFGRSYSSYILKLYSMRVMNLEEGAKRKEE